VMLAWLNWEKKRKKKRKAAEEKEKKKRASEEKQIQRLEKLEEKKKQREETLKRKAEEKQRKASESWVSRNRDKGRPPPTHELLLTKCTKVTAEPSEEDLIKVDRRMCSST